MHPTDFSRRQMLQLMSMGILGLAAKPGQKTNHHNNEMIKRAIPSTGELLPVVGAGTWIQFDVDNTATEKAPLLEVLKIMQKNGGKLIDSSPMYNRSEQMVGTLTQETGAADDFFYATKVWTTGKENGQRQMTESMRKMQRKKMDLMQIHNLQDWKTHLNTLQQWKAEGKIRYTGITHYTANAHPQLADIIQKKLVDFVQFNYSVRVRNAEKSLLPAAKDNGVAVIINEPFESGALFNAVKGRALPPWAAEYDIKSWGQFFLKFILSHPVVNCVIPGTSNPKHMADNMQAGLGRLPDEAARNKMAAFMDNL